MERAVERAVERATRIFASPGGHDLRVDLFIAPQARRPMPVIIFLHGGAWFLGDRSTAPDLARYFARDGFCMASIDYRPSTVAPFPANLEDVRTSIRWLRAHATEFGLDPARFGLWGTSAGAHLAALAALAPETMFVGEGHLDQPVSVKCVLDGYGPTDLSRQDEQIAIEKRTLQTPLPQLKAARAEGAAAVRAVNGPDLAAPYADPNSVASWLLGGPFLERETAAQAASPLHHARPNAPPFLIMHGLADSSVPHHQSITLHDALAALDNRVTLRLVDGLPHTFFNLTDIDEEAGPFTMRVRDHQPGLGGRESVETGCVFDVARSFFRRELVAA